MKFRIAIAVLAFMMAVALSYIAPQESTAVIYRLSVFAFILLLFASRVSSMGIFAAVDSSDPRHYAPIGNSPIIYQ